MMSLFKKMFFSVAVIFTIVFLVNIKFNVSASSSDASVRGFEIGSDWEYVGDVKKPEQKVEGSRYYEGSMWSWMGVYKYYNEPDNEMYVLLLCQSEMQPNQNHYWDQKRWNNEKMEVVFSSVSNTADVCTYSPKTTTGNVTITNSISISGKTDGETAELGYSVSSSTSYTVPEVRVKASKDGNSIISISHNFTNCKTNLDENAACCSLITRNNLSIYKIRNYIPKGKYEFSIKQICTFYRHGKFNSASVSGTLEQQFSV